MAYLLCCAWSTMSRSTKLCSDRTLLSSPQMVNTPPVYSMFRLANRKRLPSIAFPVGGLFIAYQGFAFLVLQAKKLQRKNFSHSEARLREIKRENKMMVDRLAHVSTSQGQTPLPPAPVSLTPRLPWLLWFSMSLILLSNLHFAFLL